MDDFKKLTGKSFEEAFHFPSEEDSIKRMWKGANSRYPIRILGYGEAELTITEEERIHTHIIGTTRVGKSKIIEDQIRKDIQNGHGFCFIDSSEGGQTAYDILRYCADVGYEKILFIDPLASEFFGKIPPIDVFGDYPDESAEKVWDIIQVQFQQKDASETPVIKQYLPAMVRILHEAEMTLSELQYFTERGYYDQREVIYNKIRGFNRDVMMFLEMFPDRDLFREYRPTGRRIRDIMHPILNLYFGSSRGLDFVKLVRDKWGIVVNLYPQKGFGKSPARFLGTGIIGELVRAFDTLNGNQMRENQWRGRFYLYIDEVGRYANRNLGDLLAHKGKMGLILTLAHQSLGQIEDSLVRSQILDMTSTKIAFRLESEDTNRVASMMFGGQIPDREAAYFLRRLSKQKCVIKLPGKGAITVRVPDVEQRDVKIKPYLEKIFRQDFYVPINEIKEEQRQRIPIQTAYYPTQATNRRPRRNDTTRTNNQPPQTRAATDQEPTGPAATPDRPKFEDLIRGLREDQGDGPKDDPQ